MLDYYNKRQLEIVEFAEKVYHEGLRHAGLNGTLYEDFLISYLRKDMPEIKFYKGQIYSPDKSINKTSAQYDIIICKKETKQTDFLKTVSSVISIVNPKNVYGVIELKKWAYPKMIGKEGTINYSYRAFKHAFPNLDYLFLCLRFKDRKLKAENRWHNLSGELEMEGKFCFYGMTSGKEWEFPWRESDFEKHKYYFGEYRDLLS